MTIDEMRARKRELGYTNEQIAELSGVPLGTVQKIFSGETGSPRQLTIQKLEKILDGEKKYDVPYDFPNDFVEEHGLLLREPSVYGLSYYDYRKENEKQYRSIDYSEFAPTRIEKRIGVAAGKFKVPDDDFFYDNEISDMFEEV